MATLIFSAVGAAVGSSIGGSVLGLSTAVLGRAIGASVGQAVDRAWLGQKLMGSGSDVVEQGRVERFRLNGASEGLGIPTIYGRARVGGQVIWASRFLETATDETVQTGGGKGGGGASNPATVRNYSYSVSIAIALGEGRIHQIGRVWADGVEVPKSGLNMRLYQGTEDQLPDAKIEAVEGVGNAPAYRGTVYVVFEDLALGQFGNRVPQFSFEVMRPEPQPANPETDLTRRIRAVALVPGTGEYSLATSPVYLPSGPGKTRVVNVNTPAGKPDLKVSAENLRAELPMHQSTSLVVSWFGDDLRCGHCTIAPRVEQNEADSKEMPWRVSGIGRDTARIVPIEAERPVYGGTPTDASVREAIAELKAHGRHVMFYPFVLMDQLAGNGLPDPWSGGPEQPVLPWRGRITLANALGKSGSTDGTSAAGDEVAAFFGSAEVDDFPLLNGERTYTGPSEESYRRFILHYAWVCADAGGIEAFCIGSELRGLTQIRGADDSFPAVEALRTLAADVRMILGPNTKISYAADWTEYFGYHPQDGSGDVFFHLDPLWSDPNIDFVGIDNYMPLADWRDGNNHADQSHKSIYNLDYLRGNIAGGEGFDWYYGGPEGKAAQIRLPITDGAYGEPWVFRYKDLRAWWENPHYSRKGGVRDDQATAWQPQSKPIWFTEIGCPAVDKGANAPNLFYDPKSSESSVPPYSSGQRDDFMQMQYLIAQFTYWDSAEANPTSAVYGGSMVDMDRAFVWAWDARPFPFFPNKRSVWSDGDNYERGHWLNGRVTSRSLASVVAEICAASGLTDIDTSELYGVVRGFLPDPVTTGRAALQPLMLAYGFDAIERDGRISFRTRHNRPAGAIDPGSLAEVSDVPGGLERTRSPDAETTGRIRITAMEAQGQYEIKASEAVFPGGETQSVTGVDLPLLLTQGESRAIAERWLFEARAARDGIRFALPPSRTDLAAGDLVELSESGGAALYRIDQLERSGAQIAEATRIEEQLYTPGAEDDYDPSEPPLFVEPAPVLPVFLDLPLMTGSEVPHAPHVAIAADPWPGEVALYKSPTLDGFRRAGLVESAAVIGEIETDLQSAIPGLIDRGPALRVRLYGGALYSVSETDMLNGSNAGAIGDPETGIWEVFQFANASLVGPDIYDLSGRLRGQLGTDAVMPEVWPSGSLFVLLNGALRQAELAVSERQLVRNWRIGPAARDPGDPTYITSQQAFDGVGLRPYAPVHLRMSSDAGGDHLVTWIRRTRLDGDSWAGFEVPLGEDRELYLVRVIEGAALIREETTTATFWTYAAALRASDGIAGPYALDIAQVSDRYGPGPFRRIEINE